MQQSSGLQACNFIKNRLQNGCFSANIPKVLTTAYFMEQLRWLLLNYVLASERTLKKKVSREIAFELISFFMYKYKSLQVCQLPREYLSFLQSFLNFIITKYSKQEVDANLSLCVVERSPCGLSITGDIKIYQCHVMKR